MRRQGNLYDKIGAPENLELAFWKAQRGKSSRPDVRCFRRELSVNLARLRKELESGDVGLGAYRFFWIHDPKERLICAASFRERVLHHAIMNICEPYFDRYQIYDSYACRKGKGMDSCLARARLFCRRFSWYVKWDVHQFFPSIDHGVLLRLLDRRFKDSRLMYLFSRVLDSYETSPGCGLPIGNLLSQHFANLYLGNLDHVLKDRLGVQGYVRYMDDMVVFGDDGSSLKRITQFAEEFLRSELHVSLNPTFMNRTSHGLPFLSYVIRPGGLRLSLKAKRRFKRKITLANAQESAEHALPLLAFVARADSLGFRRKTLFGTSFEGSNRVNRGGSWNNNARNCRSAYRNNNDPTNRNNNLGFRLALYEAQGRDGGTDSEQKDVSFPE